MVDKLLFIASSPGCRCQELQMVSDFLGVGVGGSNLNLLTFVGSVNFQSQSQLGQPSAVPLFSSTLNIAQRKQ